MKEKELRSYSSPLVLNEELRRIEGIIPYNSRSEYMGFYEEMAKGCFTKTLNESKDIRCLYGHDENQLLARTKNGSLRFEDRDDGLHFFFEAPSTQLGNDVLTMVRSELITGCSFGFSCVKEKNEIRNNERYRIVTEARLYEVSLVGSPAYEDSEVHNRNLDEHSDEHNDEHSDEHSEEHSDEQTETKVEETDTNIKEQTQDGSENIEPKEEQKAEEQVVSTDESKESETHSIEEPSTLTEEEQKFLNEAYAKLLEVEKKLDKRSIFIDGKCYFR